MVNVAIIGVGNMGKNHLRTYSKLKDVRIVGIADIDARNGRTLGARYNVPFFPDYTKMLASEKIDVVSICVPTSLHFLVASKCLQAKINVLLEKPIAPIISEAKKLLELARKNKVSLLVGHIERHNPAVKKAKEMVLNGDLGKICAIAFRRVGGFPPLVSDSNIAIDLAIHDIDIANYLMDSLPREVYVNKQRYHAKKKEDSVEFFMKYQNKASVYIQANWISPVKIRKLSITGTEGYLELDYITQKIEFFKSNYNKFKQANRGYSDYILLFSDPDKISISVAKKEPLEEEITYFIDSIAKKRKIDSTFALDALKIAII